MDLQVLAIAGIHVHIADVLSIQVKDSAAMLS